MNVTTSIRPLRARWLVAAVSILATVALLLVAMPVNASAHETLSKRIGGLDCNGYSPIQQALKLSMLCTDVRGDNKIDNSNTWGGRFYDNGAYIGHDEPDMTFLSSQPGSGNNVTWTFTLGTDPGGPPSDSSPGNDISHWFQLTPAPWLSMALCDPNSNPLTPCTPKSDSNAPKCIGVNCGSGAYPGAGGAFMEMQFYPPGFPPWVDGVSCDDSHYCAALTIDSLECTQGFSTCNTNCEEPLNFAFIQKDGVPAGPPNPQEQDLQTATPNGETLLMNPGDTVRIHMWDASVSGAPGQKALEVMIDDLTTHQSGFMQASAANGFQNTSIVDCSGTPFNFQPEYNTAARNNINPWGADQVDISTEFETGHWESCTKIEDPFTFSTGDLDFPGATDKSWQTCIGPYEDEGGSEGAEVSDALCYPAGDTHGDLNSAPDTTTGCLDDFFQNGDLDFDGTPYWTEWPTSTTPNAYPGSFVEGLPTTVGNKQYSQFFIQSDVALSETSCPGNTTGSSSKGGCGIPPPIAPGHFYPYWTRVTSGAKCTLEFGNVSSVPGESADDYGKDAQYGTVQTAKYGYPQFISPVHSNACT